MKILIVGGGGREHALAWKIAQSPRVTKIYCAPGNAGTASIAENVDIGAEDLNSLLDFAQVESIDLTVVGPEVPLVEGIVDKFEQHDLRIFGPSALAAKLEGSKIFSKNLMQKYNIPTAEFRSFSDADHAIRYVEDRGPVVVKADGLAAGKGVILCENAKEARTAIQQIMKDRAFGDAGGKIVIEEWLRGKEVSLLALTDGKTVLPLEGAEDHKAVFDGDVGPNTGGMGAYSPSPIFTEELKQQVLNDIMNPTVQAMENEGAPYKGVLYAGLMITDDGPKTLEFNARMGDPETQPLMARMESDLVPLLEACIDGTLDQQKIEWSTQASVCVVMASGGYPGSYKKGIPIEGLAEADSLEGVTVFHAGTRRDGDQVVTNGGRVLGVTSLGTDVSTAIANAYSAVDKIKWPEVHYRKDIGRR
ncbi:MAG: phosphoribosylamine--glycine ligase [Candidatus Nitronauta litoralis]|uniref:Phosphoribosylamine--glycine ligase n=1 Tax=Candidatus Nitronauta litoralis TaxID=2705533 RepID=A0A7T0BV71_9BACT|nr:MAG: phosphoribosylamine--glycine ligase [Candidatus Nitronauta litoralis]